MLMVAQAIFPTIVLALILWKATKLVHARKRHGSFRGAEFTRVIILQCRNFVSPSRCTEYLQRCV